MIWSFEIRQKILGHHRRNMSLRSIAAIYGCTEADVRGVVEEGKPKRTVLSAVPVKPVLAHASEGLGDEEADLPQQLFDALPLKQREYAEEVARLCGVKVSALFADKSKRPAHVFCRGCFFYGLNCQYQWSYDVIACSTGVTAQAVCSAIKHYCERTGSPRPAALIAERRGAA